MGLLTKKLIRKLPELYSTEHEPLEEKMVLAKFFHSWSGWTWYIIEFDKDDLCWGLVKGHETEFGYFSISELSNISAPFGTTVERDLHFEPTKVKDLVVFGQGGAVY